MKKRTKKQSAGFTLIEIVTTLAIVAVIFSIAVSSSNRMSSRSNINLVTESLVSDIRTTAMSAMNSEQFQTQSPIYWGIRLKTDETPANYTVFADTNGDSFYNNNEKFKAIFLNKNIRLNCTTFHNQCWGTGSVLFTAGEAKPYFEGGGDVLGVDTKNGDVSIELEDITTGDKKVIVINALGLVDPQ
ncbi:MAG: prepilin-type N-terminal cleavage/methylation domain-containing protein [Candidatus Falkowbacteria bacterium]|nr:prepilin-type N-terminal cleavage/methylation domain-containing protein [Candidatus Falkowbacteria bacterium]